MIRDANSSDVSADMVELGKVLIGCPIRNRAWILPHYLEALKGLDYNHKDIEYCFIVNNSTDDTLEILKNFRYRTPSLVRIITCDLAREKNHRRGYYSLSHLATLRNILLAEFLKSDASYLFSVDSDIILPPHALKSLQRADCDIISALVCNGHEIGDPDIYNILNRRLNGRYEYIRNFPQEEVFAVDCTGAAYLIKRDVIAKHQVRYSATCGSEDIGFCEDARAKGIGIYCHPAVKARHEMIEGG